jgi:outer membrane receptor protein involved in Fe transport
MKINIIKKRHILSYSVAFAAFAFVNYAYADDVFGPSEEQIIVTGKSKAQKSPLAVSVYNQQKLEDNGVHHISELVQITPFLQLPQSESASSVTARIRGVGTQGTNVGLEPSVGVVIDNVYRARTSVAFGDLGELERVEILRGPQSTIMGRNTTAGLIAVKTKEPTQTTETWGEFTKGNYNATGLAAGISGGVIKDKLAASIFGVVRNRDGYFTVNEGQPNERKDNDVNYWLVRSQAVFTPNNALKARLIFDISERNEACCNAFVYVPDSRTPVNSTAILNRIAANALSTTQNQDDYKASADRSFDQIVHDRGLSLDVDYNFGDKHFKSVTSYRYFQFAYAQDGEWSGADILYRDLSERPGNKVKEFTQEVSLNGETGKLNWKVGAFYSHEQTNSHNVFRYGADYETYIGGLFSGAGALTNPVSGFAQTLRNLISSATGGVFNANSQAMSLGGGWSDYFEQNADSIALYSHNIYALSDELNLTLGLRYNHLEKDFKASYETTGSAGCAAIEQVYGFDPSAVAPSNLAGVVGTVCVPWARSALDGFDHRQSFKDDQFSGVLSLDYRPTENIFIYATYAHGHKAGGFNLDRVMSDSKGSIVSGAVGSQTIRAPDTSFPAEVVDNYEMGIKNTWFGGDLKTALAIFKADYSDYQLNTYNGISQIVASVPKVYSKGAEFEINYKTPIKGLRYDGGLAYYDTKYMDDLGNPADFSTFLGQNLNLYLIAGQQLTASPKWTVTNNITYENVGFGHDYRINFNHRHTSSFNGGSNLDGRKVTRELDLYNASVTLTVREGLDLMLWGNNLSDEHYAQIYFDGPLQGSSPLISKTGAVRAITSQVNGFPAEPRMYGATIRWKY